MSLNNNINRNRRDGGSSNNNDNEFSNANLFADGFTGHDVIKDIAEWWAYVLLLEKNTDHFHQLGHILPSQVVVPTLENDPLSIRFKLLDYWEKTLNADLMDYETYEWMLNRIMSISDLIQSHNRELNVQVDKIKTLMNVHLQLAKLFEKVNTLAENEEGLTDDEIKSRMESMEQRYLEKLEDIFDGKEVPRVLFAVMGIKDPDHVLKRIENIVGFNDEYTHTQLNGSIHSLLQAWSDSLPVPVLVELGYRGSRRNIQHLQQQVDARSLSSQRRNHNRNDIQERKEPEDSDEDEKQDDDDDSRNNNNDRQVQAAAAPQPPQEQEVAPPRRQQQEEVVANDNNRHNPAVPTDEDSDATEPIESPTGAAPAQPPEAPAEADAAPEESSKKKKRAATTSNKENLSFDSSDDEQNSTVNTKRRSINIQNPRRRASAPEQRHRRDDHSYDDDGEGGRQRQEILRRRGLFYEFTEDESSSDDEAQRRKQQRQQRGRPRQRRQRRGKRDHSTEDDASSSSSSWDGRYDALRDIHKPSNRAHHDHRSQRHPQRSMKPAARLPSSRRNQNQRRSTTDVDRRRAAARARSLSSPQGSTRAHHSLSFPLSSPTPRRSNHNSRNRKSSHRRNKTYPYGDDDDDDDSCLDVFKSLRSNNDNNKKQKRHHRHEDERQDDEHTFSEEEDDDYDMNNRGQRKRPRVAVQPRQKRLQEEEDRDDDRQQRGNQFSENAEASLIEFINEFGIGNWQLITMQMRKSGHKGFKLSDIRARGQELLELGVVEDKRK